MPDTDRADCRGIEKDEVRADEAVAVSYGPLDISGEKSRVLSLKWDEVDVGGA